MITMAKIAAGRSAWTYFMDKVSDDAAATQGKAASYYIKGGNPPGRWYGAGLPGVGLSGDAVVDGAQLEQLFGTGSHPITGEQLGRPFTEQVPLATRIDARVTALSATLPHEERAQAIERIVEEEAARRSAASVAGFEVIFNPPKSVSTWWALADAGLKDEILAAHHAAVQSTLQVLERDAARTRTGIDGVAQETTRGIIAAGFDHWETREGDPQLHTHLLIANRVQGEDGIWRTLDSRHALSPSIVTLSEQYDSDLMDQLSLRFGVRWIEQSISKDGAAYQAWISEQSFDDSQAARATFALMVAQVARKNQKWEIEGIPQELLDKFSSRAKQVKAGQDALMKKYVDTHGQPPGRYTVLRMRATAAIHSRKAKQNHTLKGLTKTWRAGAGPIVGDTFRFAARIHAAGAKRSETLNAWSFRADDVPPAHLTAAVTAALGDLSTSHTTWSRANARAAALRVVAPWTFRSPADRDQVVTDVVTRMLDAALPLTPRNLLHTPRKFRLPDGTSSFHSALQELFTTREVFEAETRLVSAGDTITELVVTVQNVDRLIAAPTVTGRILSDDQADAVTKIVRSGRAIDVLVGPAGAGKTTTLEKVRELWEADHGAGSVRGLAPTAKAAQVLAESLGIGTENTAKWIHETTTRDLHSAEFHLRAGDLIIVDEASIAGTMSLDVLRGQADQAGAKLLLVGDWAQLSAVDAGGAFGMLARHRDNPPELLEIHRFTNRWEAAASTLIRLGKQAGLRPYLEQDRVSWGYTDTLIHEAVAAWKADETAGKESLLIAPTNEVAAQLNLVARAWRIDQGFVEGAEVSIATGVIAAGDRIVTRKNDRTLTTSGGSFVRNNTEWIVRTVNRDGSIIADSNHGSIVLPAAYVAEHAQLAYATTAHRAQGRTVDTGHTIVDATTTRENFYVAITRGRRSNQVYVAVDPPEAMEGWANSGAQLSHLDVLDTIIRNTGAELSAHETLIAELERTQSIMQLAAEYETLAQAAALSYYDQLIRQAGLTTEHLDSIRESPSFGPLVAALRRADDHGLNTTKVLPALTAERPITASDDPAAILHYRVTQWFGKHKDTATPDRIAGLVTRSRQAAEPDMQDALDEHAAAIQHRAEIVLDRAIAAGEPWLATLTDLVLGHEETARRAATVIAAYRDKYGLDGEPSPLGASEGLTTTRKADYVVALAALNQRGTQSTPFFGGEYVARPRSDIYIQTVAASTIDPDSHHEPS